MGKLLFIDFLLIEKITCHAFESHTHRKSLPNNLEGFLCIFDYYGNHVNPNRVISFKKLYIMALLAGSILALTIFLSDTPSHLCLLTMFFRPKHLSLSAERDIRFRWKGDLRTSFNFFWWTFWFCCSEQFAWDALLEQTEGDAKAGVWYCCGYY